MIVSEVMPPPDCHDDPTAQHGTGFLSSRHGCQLGIEGLVSKRLGSAYRSGQLSRRCSIFNFTMLSYTSRTPSGFIEPCHPPGYYPSSLRDEMD